LLVNFNEFVKVTYVSKPVLLHARLGRKQRQWIFKILHISEGSCTVSVMF